MFDTVFGLPVHPLVVHATVVLVPAAAVAVTLAALWPAFRRRAGVVPLALSLVALVLVPLSTQSGEALERRVDHSATLERHTQLADGLLPWVALLVVAAAALYWHHRRSSGGATVPRLLVVAGIALGLVGAAGTTFQVIRIGHTGAQAAWSDVAKAAPRTGGDGGK